MHTEPNGASVGDGHDDQCGKHTTVNCHPLDLPYNPIVVNQSCTGHRKNHEKGQKAELYCHDSKLRSHSRLPIRAR